MEITEEDRNQAKWNVSVKALITVMEALTLQSICHIPVENIEECSLKAHEFSDNLLTNFVCNFLRSKCNPNKKDALVGILEQFKKRLDDWYDFQNKALEEEKKGMN